MLNRRQGYWVSLHSFTFDGYVSTRFCIRFWGDQTAAVRAACEKQLDSTSSTHPTFVYLTPERLEQPCWKERISDLVRNNHVARFVIDEAQCIVEVSDTSHSPT